MATTKVYEWSLRWSLQTRTPEGLVAFKEAQNDLQMLLTLLCKHFVYQLELTDEWNWHYQGHLNLKTKKCLKTIVNDFQETFPGIHFQKSSTAGRKALQAYCIKDDTRQDGPWADTEVYRGQDLYANPYPWQADLEAMCLKKPDDRHIYWIYNPTGCAGKSKFTKRMSYKHKANSMAYSKTGDLLNFVYKTPIKRIFLFDLPRSKPLDIGWGDLYSALESIKNGQVFNSKYETGCCLFMPPHVLVFANSKPDLANLSTDRWKCKSLYDGILYEGLLDAPPVIVRANAMNFPPPVNIRGDEMEQPFNELVYIQPADDLAYIEDWEEKVGQFIDMECME